MVARDKKERYMLFPDPAELLEKCICIAHMNKKFVELFFKNNTCELYVTLYKDTFFFVTFIIIIQFLHMQFVKMQQFC